MNTIIGKMRDQQAEEHPEVQGFNNWIKGLKVMEMGVWLAHFSGLKLCVLVEQSMYVGIPVSM